MTRCPLLPLFLAGLLVTSTTAAFQEPESSPSVTMLEMRLDGLDVEGELRSATLLPETDASRRSLEALGVAPEHAHLDLRSGRWATLLLKEPLLPGHGVGNDLGWPAFGFEASPDVDTLEDLAWRRFVAFLDTHREILGVDTSELQRRVAVHDGGRLIQIHAPRQLGGITFKRSHVSATINQGNLILLGAHLWGDTDPRITTPALGLDVAQRTLREHLGSHPANLRWELPAEAELVIVPIEGRPDLAASQAISPYDYRLAWQLQPRFPDSQDLANWQALVDAHSGQLMEWRDTNEYTRSIRGGVFPISNDGEVGADADSGGGMEVAGYPMPFADAISDGSAAFTDGGGNVEGAVGTLSTTLSGRFVSINDLCGFVDESTDGGVLDLGTSDGTDCAAPAGASPGNTHSARSGFYELNRMAESARAYLPGNSWLQQPLLANMNINQSCNAFWSGSSVNFYRQGGPCANTGEIAGVFDHEWGHGMDDNDLSGALAVPSGAAADLYAALRLNTSCIGRGFVTSQCSGYGDPCTDCTGVRDIDWARHASAAPHDVDWADAVCGGTGSHCCGLVPAEAVWDFVKRDLPSFYGQDNNTALEITTRLMFLGAGNVSTWYSGPNGEAGCAATHGYMQFLASDDDDGDLSNGTPHMQALFAAFDRHGIACSTPSVQDSGCADRPVAAPTVQVTTGDRSATLSWDAVADATRYKVYRTEGEFGCDFGKVLLGETTALHFTADTLPNDRETYFVVAAFNASDSCMGPTSACLTAVPGGTLFTDGFESGDTGRWSNQTSALR